MVFNLAHAQVSDADADRRTLSRMARRGPLRFAEKPSGCTPLVQGRIISGGAGTPLDRVMTAADEARGEIEAKAEENDRR
jgi:hypothetical protein